MLWFQLFLPFAAGFFLSYVYRTANAILAPIIGAELGLGEGEIGLLTSTYFLAFALAQLPVGVLLDRYGPRRVESALLLVTAAGAVIYGTAESLLGLAAGRAIIGLGVSACLMGPLKAFAIFYPKERLASLTGWVMVAGGLGAIVAATPLDWVLGLVSWRSLCLMGAALTLVVAAMIFFVVPDRESGGGARGVPLMDQVREMHQVFVSPQFRRFAPMAFLFTGAFQALQGLWAARWIAVQSGAGKAAVAAQLTTMSVASLIGMLCMGAFATRLVLRGVRLENLYRIAMALALGLNMLLVWQGGGQVWLWPLLALCFSFNNIAYTLLAQTFPASFAGRANTALNMVILLGAFSLQWGLGVLVDGLERSGLVAADAYRASFGLLALAQVLALLYFLKPSSGGGAPVAGTKTAQA